MKKNSTWVRSPAPPSSSLRHRLVIQVIQLRSACHRRSLYTQNPCHQVSRCRVCNPPPSIPCSARSPLPFSAVLHFQLGIIYVKQFNRMKTRRSGMSCKLHLAVTSHKLLNKSFSWSLPRLLMSSLDLFMIQYLSSICWSLQ